MKRPGRIVIVGAGPCGLGVAYRLDELRYDDFIVYERSSHVGGLASSVQDDKGFVWDYGCHVLYSRSLYFNRVMDQLLAGEWIEQPRDAQVWMLGCFVPYPLQYNVHRLPDDVRRECVQGLASAALRTGPDAPLNFREWIENSFGEGIARHFMIPYNQKIWAHPLEKMDAAWIAERVPSPDLTRVLANLRHCKDDSAWGPNARFRYPQVGGTGAVWRRVAERVGSARIKLDQTVTQIDTKERRVHFADGGEENYDVLVSTMPIDRLVALAGIERLGSAAAALSSSTVHIVGIGIEGKLPAELVDRKWIYFPEPDLPFYRMTVLSNFAPSNAPAGHWSLLAEVAQSAYKPVNDATIVEDVIAGARRAGFIPTGSRVVSRFHHVAAPGYPTPTISRDPALAVLFPALETLGIYSRGRFGAWRYEISNQDHSFLQGAELAGRLVLGETEPTLAS